MNSIAAYKNGSSTEMHEMFTTVEWKERNFGVPLAQLEPIDVDESTQEAIEDWHYWVKRGYQLG